MHLRTPHYLFVVTFENASNQGPLFSEQPMVVRKLLPKMRSPSGQGWLVHYSYNLYDNEGGHISGCIQTPSKMSQLYYSVKVSSPMLILKH